MADLLKKYDELLKDTGPAAIVLKQWLRPVGDDVFFPPTYANPSQKKGDPPVYNIDPPEQSAPQRVCIVDSIPSQANRIEPAFDRLTDKQGQPVRLVPKVIVKTKTGDEQQQVSLLEVGHRLADAVVQLSSLRGEVAKAIRERQKNDSLPLAKLAPTSLVFGMWDSRESGVKVPRLINSIIRAYDVLEHRRSSQFNPALDFEAAGVVPVKGEKKLSEVGMDGVPDTLKLGGIAARGGICRDSSLNLCTLRDIATSDKADEVKLQRYILGLSLVAMTFFDGKALNLRQGCQLVADKAKPMTRVLVFADGTESPFDVDHNAAIEYADVAARAFGVGQDYTDVTFDVKAAKAALKKSKKDAEEPST